MGMKWAVTLELNFKLVFQWRPAHGVALVWLTDHLQGILQEMKIYYSVVTWPVASTFQGWAFLLSKRKQLVTVTGVFWGGFLEEAAVSPTEQRGSERWLSWRTLRQSTGLKWKLSQTCTGDGVVYVIEGKQQESQKKLGISRPVWANMAHWELGL